MRNLVQKKWWVFEFDRAGDIAQLKIWRYAIYQRAGSFCMVLGIPLNIKKFDFLSILNRDKND